MTNLKAGFTWCQVVWLTKKISHTLQITQLPSFVEGSFLWYAENMIKRLTTAVKNQQMIALIAVVIGSAVAILDGSIVNLALPKIGLEWHVGYSSLQWISDAYLLSLSSLILLGGSLGDILGRKKVYLIGVVGFGVVSLLCALSVNVVMLVILRIIQGVFGALLVPGALSIITTNFKAKDQSVAIGRWTAWSSIAVVLSPFLGGWILAVTSWRWIFLINVPLAFICFALAKKAVVETKDSHSRQIDWVGAVLAACALAGVTYGLIEGPGRHWSLGAVMPLLAGVLLTGLFILYEKRHGDPMVKLELFKSRNFTGSNMMTFLMYGALGGFTFALVIYLQTYMHYTAFAAGIGLLPISIFMILFSGRVGHYSAKLGARLFMTVGPIVAGSGIFYLLFLKPGDSYWTSILPGIVLFAIGLTLLVAPLTTTVMTAVNQRNSGIASGINNAVARSAGMIVVAALGLFGASQAYAFAMTLCAVLAVLSGLISFVLIRKPVEKELTTPPPIA